MKWDTAYRITQDLSLGMLRSIGPRSVSADNHILWLDRYSLTWPISRTDRNLMTSARECEDAREHSAAVMSSPVWNFYDVARNNEKFAICRVCSKEISRGGVLSKTFNTTNLIRHLRTSHRETYAEYEKLATAKKGNGKPNELHHTYPICSFRTLNVFFLVMLSC